MISIIIPVYNKETTIDRCLKSVLDQDYQDIEIILIDDGSTDKSGTICQEYSNSYSNVVYITRPNKGLSYTYKQGIDVSNGNFVLFLDSDDYIEKKMLSHLYKTLTKENADIVQSGVIQRRTDEKIIRKDSLQGRVITSKNEILEGYFLTNTINRTFAGSLFRRELFNNINFPLGALSIDLQTIPFILEKSKKMVQLTECYYNAINYEDSVSRGAFSENMFKDVNDCSRIWQSFFEFFSPDMIEIMYYRHVQASSYLFYKIMEKRGPVYNKKDKINMCISAFMSNYQLFKTSNIYCKIKTKEKIKINLFHFSPMLFFLTIRLYGFILNQKLL